MNTHFRTAVLTVILAGGTLSAYATAWTMMGGRAAPAMAVRSVDATSRMSPGQTDLSVRELCADVDGARARGRCLRDLRGATRTVRVVAAASPVPPSGALLVSARLEGATRLR